MKRVTKPSWPGKRSDSESFSRARAEVRVGARARKNCGETLFLDGLKSKLLLGHFREKAKRPWFGQQGRKTEVWDPDL